MQRVIGCPNVHQQGTRHVRIMSNLMATTPPTRVRPFLRSKHPRQSGVQPDIKLCELLPTRPAHTAGMAPLSAFLGPPPLLFSRPPARTPRRARRARRVVCVAASDSAAKRLYISRVREALTDRCVGAEDAFWAAMQAEARAAAEEEPLLASFLFATVLNHRSLKNALAFHLANKLASSAMPSTLLMRLFQDAMVGDESFCTLVRLDLLAVMERDPACTRFIDAFLYFKGFQALQAYRVAHSLWKQERIPLASHLQSQVSKELQVDIHPAAVIGSGAFFDHATGVVIGETAVIGENVSMLHHVTLGGSGKKHGKRHPNIGDGVLIGAGATILGNVHVGDGVQIGACSLVLEDIPAHATVVGVPAKVVGIPGIAVPAMDMKHERCLEGKGDDRIEENKAVDLNDGVVTGSSVAASNGAATSNGVAASDGAAATNGIMAKSGGAEGNGVPANGRININNVRDAQATENGSVSAHIAKSSRRGSLSDSSGEANDDDDSVSGYYACL